jgi:hypothetical protein
MDPAGNAAGSGDEIFLEFGGSAFIAEGLFDYSISANSDGSKVSAQGQASKTTAAASQAASQEEDDDVDWAAFSEEVTVYEINNNGLQLPQTEEVDEFAKMQEEAQRNLAEETETVTDVVSIFDGKTIPEGIPVSQLTEPR